MVPAIVIRPAAVTVDVRDAIELRQDEIAAWHGILADEPLFASPFFTPEYVRLVAGCVDDVKVGLLRLGGAVVGFFPFEVEAAGRARPVGSVFNDYQGVVIRRDVEWSMSRLLDQAQLEEWRFDHGLAVQRPLTPYVRKRDVSWSISLSHGYSAYEAGLREGRHRILVEMRRKRRMTERDLGPVRLDAHRIDHDLLDQLLDLKSAQWARSGWLNRFSSPWERCLMHQLLETESEAFAGLFSVLWAGDIPLAMHIGMRSRRVWHYWTTGYDESAARYSPGNLMLLEMIRAAPAMGLDELDLGKEDFEYKRRLHTHVVMLVEGVATSCIDPSNNAKGSKL